MAERRMISKSISVSEKVNSMSLFARLLFTWMIPHTDDFGRMPGSPMKVRALVVPMADETKEDVERALCEMVEQDLIDWYEVDGKKYVQIKNFDKHQTGLHKRTKSQYPAPEEGTPVLTVPSDSERFREVPGSSGNVPGVPENSPRNEQNRTEQKRREQPTNITEAMIEDPAAGKVEPENDVGWLDGLPDESESDPMSKALQQIEHRFIQRRGLGIVPSAKDIESMRSLLEDGIPLAIILEGIDHAFDNFKPQHKRDGIKKFAYCETVIRSLYERRKAHEKRVAVGARDPGPDREDTPRLSKPGALKPISEEERRRLDELAKTL